MEYPFHSQLKDNWLAHDDRTISVTDDGTDTNINKKRQPKLTLFCLQWSPAHVGHRKLFQFDGIAAGTS
jgi:hypothetical protein